jgi:hypothetical protein
MLASRETNSSILFVKGPEGRETTEMFAKLDKWDKKKVCRNPRTKTRKRKSKIITFRRL